MKKSILAFSLLCVFHFTACLSFKGISIDPNISTYYIDNFQLSASSAPADLANRFTEELIQKVNNNTRLIFNDTNPDIEFIGSMTKFRVSAVAPQANDEFGSSAFNRLEITANVEYINNLSDDEKDSWKRSFSFFQDFDSTTDLNSVQDDLIDDIFEQITEDIFNATFTDW